MKKAIAASLMLLILTGCEDSKRKDLEKDITDMVTEASLLREDIASRDKYIDEVLRSVRQVYLGLDETVSKETMFSNRALSTEGMPKHTNAQTRQAALDEITAINSDLKANREKIRNLQAGLHLFEAKYARPNDLNPGREGSLVQRERVDSLFRR